MILQKKKQAKFRSLQRKISGSILFLTFLILVFIQVQLYALVYRQTNRQSYDNCETQLLQSAKYMQEKMRSVIEKMFYIRKNESFERCLNQILFEDKQQNNGLILGQMANILSYHKSTEPLLSTIYLYTPKGNFSDMTVLENKEYQFETDTLYKRFQSESSSVIWGDPCKDSIFITRRPVIPVIYKFEVDGIREPVGLLANIDQTRLTSYMEERSIDNDSFTVLITNEGKLVTNNIPLEYDWILHGKESVLPFIQGENGIKSFKKNGVRILVGYQKVISTPWYVLHIQLRTKLDMQMLHFTYIFLAVNLIAALFISVFNSRIVKKITDPIIQLAHIMETTGAKDYDVLFQYEKPDEIKILADSFNGMVRDTKALFQEQERYIEQLKEEKERVRIEQLLKRRAEFIALQAQINPHFLYNTLDSIRWKAEELGAEEISEMVQALATLFRIDLSRGQEMISISQELSHVTSYLSIQRYRYGEGLNYYIEADEKISGFYVPKIILQPLVENSIDHGIKEKEGIGTIVITGIYNEAANQLTLQVLDNGMGIGAEKLALIQSNLAKGMVVNKEGYGIFNVNERIRLYFGETYHLTITSKYGIGTLVELVLPGITEDEVEKYVPYFDRRR